MPVTRDQAREVARRFLSVFGQAPANEAVVIDWSVILTMTPPITSMTPRNWTRHLAIVIARHFLNDPAVFIGPTTWNQHIDGLTNQRETFGEFIDFLQGEL